MHSIRIALLLLVAAGPAAAEDDVPWALRPLTSPKVPDAGQWAGTPIDGFVLKNLKEHGLTPMPRADKRTLLRRLTFDLTGLPPSPEEIQAFLDDNSPQATITVVDRLLSSPRYGERWARHWMDVMHFAETHGHDEDAIRENAWPYRDYLVRSFNEDKPYAQFVREQIAGDVLFPDDPWATVATGFLASGPWDESSQMGIQDGTIDKKIAQYLDRDDMITTAMSTFVSATAHCARCHDHKFDPISTEDYYALQAVFAGVDRVDRPYELDPAMKKRRTALEAQKAELDAGRIPAALANDAGLKKEHQRWAAAAIGVAGQWLPLQNMAAASEAAQSVEQLPDQSVRFSGGRPEIDSYRIEGISSAKQVTAISLEVLSDESLPKNGPGRQDNGNLHLSEVQILHRGQTVAIARAEADFNQAGWTIEHAIDGNPKSAWGIFPRVGETHRAMFVLTEPLRFEKPETITVLLKQLHGGGHLIGRPRITVTGAADPKLPPVVPSDPSYLAFLKNRVTAELAGFGTGRMVYAVASHWDSKGNFMPARGPRPVHLLHRGDIHSPGPAAQPGTLSCITGPAARFELPDAKDEGARRAALADWLAHQDNVLTWRSIANRVWHHHFGLGIVATPNDLGAMGARPTHPELLDWLAFELRAHGGSLKWLHRVICNSSSYAQQASAGQHRLVRTHRLDAESIRDAVLQMSGKMDLTMGGPSARQFHATKGVHVTPTLDYLGFDPDDPANFRRSVYRFSFRTVPDPLMAALDCPDASQLAPVRETSITALQALAMMNNRFLVRQCEHLAARLQRERADLPGRIDLLFELAYGRQAKPEERQSVAAYAEKHGLANACRVIINSSEFVFVR